MSKDAFYLFANWKMYLDHAESVALAKELKQQMTQLAASMRVAVFPSMLAMTAVEHVLQGTSIALGAQNIHWVDKGGYTGEVSGAMCKAVGCTYALVGHSERRHVFHETNQEVRKKIDSLLALGMTPVLCVGETLHEREKNVTEEVVETQLRSAFEGIAWPAGQELFIAYEPVWAVSTGEACDPQEAQRVSSRIYDLVEKLVPSVTPIVLYGGSVRPENVGQYCAQQHISGVLVGGAATKITTWMDIVRAIQL